jgi:anthranilate synthase component 1
MDFKEIKETSKNLGYPCVIPVVKAMRNIEELLPTDVYAELMDENGYSFLLESAELGEKTARYSYLGRKPKKVITVEKGRLSIDDEDSESKNLLSGFSKLISRYNAYHGKLPKFYGGLLGYFSYDVVRHFEDIGDIAIDELNQGDAQFIFVKDLIAFDHWRDEILLISNIIIEEEKDIEKERDEAMKKISEMEELVKRVKKQKFTIHWTSKPLSVKSNFKKDEFERAVKAAKEHIYAGDIFQVVLSQRFQVDGGFDPFQVYMTLKEINPSPYMYLLDFGRTKIIGSSPEILVKVDGRTVTVRPIAGTRPRGDDIVEDESLAREMMNDEKERAEHVMLVDLGRNDIGKISEFGTVEVTEFFGIEKYSHVQHIISNVKGEIRRGMDSFNALEAAFPAGTVTGAPKVRAMQIIEELEPTRRGIYAGSVGHFCFDGNMDFAITIRTIVLEDERPMFRLGLASSQTHRLKENTRKR